jgi:hypothetical protein
LYQYVNGANRTTVGCDITKPANTTRRTTTPKNKVISATAVAPVIYVSIPAGVLLVGIVASVLMALFVYQCKPVNRRVAAIKQHNEVEIVHTLVKEQDVEMNALEGKNYIKF